MSVDVELDPVLIAVVQGALSNIQAEMTATLRQSGRSAVATIAHDYSNAIFDHDTEMVLQGEDLPAHLGSLMAGAKGVAEYFGKEVYDGDLYYHNDPTYGGSHITDMCAYKPVFVDGELAFWAVSKLHVVDCGGPVAGGYNSTATDIYSEGLRIPPIRLVDKGTLRSDILNMILLNVRVSENQAGDIRAQFGAVNIAAKRLKELCAKYGLATIRAILARLKDLADRQMRALVSAIPDGTSVGMAIMEDTGHGLGDIELKAHVTVEGDQLHIRLESPPQIPYYANSYKSNTISGVYLGLIMWAQVPPPYNEGLYRCVTIDYGPEGTLLNAVEPAAHVMSTSMPNENVTEAVRRALAAAKPTRLMAEWGATFGCTLAGVDPRTDEEFVTLSVAAIISGAGAIEDAMDGWHMIGPANTLGALTSGDTETIEAVYPYIVHEYMLREDSAGPGYWRGGCGNRMTIEPLGDMSVAIVGSGFRAPARGEKGADSRIEDSKKAIGIIQRADGTREDVVSARQFKLHKGDRYTHLNPGGGGVGDAYDRPVEHVLEDVRNRLVSPEAARIEYGVVMSPDLSAVDEKETSALRATPAVELA
jgi:N-methylhydantoinase B